MKKLILLITTLILVTISCTPSSPPTTNAPTINNEEPKQESPSESRPAEFTVSELNINPAKGEATPGTSAPFTATITITNVGGTRGDYTATLKVDGNPEIPTKTKSVSLNPGEETNLRFQFFQKTVGTFQLEVGGLIGSFSLVEKLSEPHLVHERGYSIFLTELDRKPNPDRRGWDTIEGILSIYAVTDKNRHSRIVPFMEDEFQLRPALYFGEITPGQLIDRDSGAIKKIDLHGQSPFDKYESYDMLRYSRVDISFGPFDIAQASNDVWIILKNSDSGVAGALRTYAPKYASEAIAIDETRQNQWYQNAIQPMLFEKVSHPESKSITAQQISFEAQTLKIELKILNTSATTDRTIDPVGYVELWGFLQANGLVIGDATRKIQNMFEITHTTIPPQFTELAKANLPLTSVPSQARYAAILVSYPDQVSGSDMIYSFLLQIP